MLKSSTGMHFSSSNGYNHSPRDLLTGAAVTSTGSGGGPTLPPTPVNLDVQRIDNTEGTTVVMLKLTDEMFSALEAGQKSGKKLRIHVDEREGRVEIGDGTASSKTNNTFYFQKQSAPDQTDTLVQAGGVVRNVGTYKTRYQIQATDRSFEETKKRAELRAEVEKSRGTKEMKKSVSSSSSRYLNSSSSTPRNMGSSLSGSNSSRVSPAFMSTKASTSQHPHSKGTPNGSENRKTDMLKPELMRQSVKKRIIHLVVTQKYKNWEEVYKKLQSDGIPDDKNDADSIRSFVEEVSEMRSGASVLSLRTNRLSDVDARWMFFNQDEKAHVRKLQANPTGPRAVAASEAANFAPMRKKGMERMTASSKSSYPDKEKVKIEEKTPSPPKVEKRVESDDDYYVAPEVGVKRRAHNLAPLPVPQTTSSQTEGPSPPKRTKRNESTSPPEDPPQKTPETAKLNPVKLASMVAMQPMPKFEQPREHSVAAVAANGGGSTASSRISSPASSLSSPSQPSCNWEKQFGDIKSLNEAEEYFQMFHKEYPLYMECHKKLTEVSAEFRKLESKLNRASEQRKATPCQATIQEVKNVERLIQKRYAFFEKDPEFMRARQRHTDLRSKLNVLKTRIGSWESHKRQTVTA